jgi:hypothetical protein
MALWNYSSATRPNSASLLAFAVGATAIGVFAIGALAIGRLAIRNARIKTLEVDELTIRKLNLAEQSPHGRLTSPTPRTKAPIASGTAPT